MDFETARYAQSGGDMALVIDVQLGCLAYMTTQDAADYLDNLGQTLDEMRYNGTPVTWVTMSDRNQLHRPLSHSSNADNVRPEHELEEMKFFATGDDFDRADLREVFTSFLEKHGTRQNEAVFQKYFKGAFVSSEDARGRPEYQEILEGETGQSFSDILPEKIDQNELRDFVKESCTGHTILMGAVSTHCIAETAISGVEKGLRQTIRSDLVLGWQGNENADDYTYDRLVWRDEATFHDIAIRERLDGIKNEDGRRLSENSKMAIDNIQITDSKREPQPDLTNQTMNGQTCLWIKDFAPGAGQGQD